MKLEAILPQRVTFAFQPLPLIELGLEGMLEGSSYHGDPDRYGVENPQLRYSVARAGPTLGVSFASWLHLRLAGGYTFLRRIEFYDGTDEVASYDLHNSAYFRTTLSFGGR